MGNWYTSRESVKRAAGINGSAKDTIVDSHIEAASRLIDAELGVRPGYFIPETKVRYFNWSQDPDVASLYRRSYVLMLDEDLISLSGLTSDNGTVTIPTAEVNLEPVNEGPPYRRIEIDKATGGAKARSAADSATTQDTR